MTAGDGGTHPGGQGAATPAGQAAGSSFYAGMRILPKPQREAMYAVYAFCRAVDDVADEGGSPADRMAGLARWRDAIEALYRGHPTSETQALAGPVRQFDLAKEDFLAVIDGMAMDAEGDIRAPAPATLDLYCDRVASAVGRLSVRIFGLSPHAGLALAHHLGRALQKTNILRDLDEDAARGRLYLPGPMLEGAGIASTDPATVIADPALGRACAPLVAEARAHFEAANRVMARERRRSTRAPRLMAAVYRALLEKTAARGFKPPRRRVKVSKIRLLFAALRHGLL